MVCDCDCHLAPTSILNTDEQYSLHLILNLREMSPETRPPNNGPTMYTSRFSRCPETIAGPMLRAGFREALVKGPSMIMRMNNVSPTSAELAFVPSPRKGLRITMESTNVPTASNMVPVQGGTDEASKVEPRYFDAPDVGKKRLRIIPPVIPPK